jgi:hypothetical protein
LAALAGGAAAVEARVRWEKDAQGELLVFDCSNNSKEEAYALFEAFDREVRSKAEGGVRVLADFENAYHAADLTARWKGAYQEHAKHVRKMACLGVTNGMKIVFAAYRFYSRLRGIDVDAKLKVLDDEAQARAWLAEP